MKRLGNVSYEFNHDESIYVNFCDRISRIQ